MICWLISAWYTGMHHIYPFIHGEYDYYSTLSHGEWFSGGVFTDCSHDIYEQIYVCVSAL